MTRTSRKNNFIGLLILSVLNFISSYMNNTASWLQYSSLSKFMDNIPSDTNRMIFQYTFNGISDIISICEYAVQLRDTNEKLLFLFGILSLIFTYKMIIEKFITAKDKSLTECTRKELTSFFTDNIFFTAICYMFFNLEPAIYGLLPKTYITTAILIILIVVLFYLAFPVMIYLFFYIITAVIYMTALLTLCTNINIHSLICIIISVLAGIIIDYAATKLMFYFSENSIKLK